MNYYILPLKQYDVNQSICVCLFVRLFSQKTEPNELHFEEYDYH